MFSNDNHVFQVPIIYRTNPKGSPNDEILAHRRAVKRGGFFFKILFFIFNKEKYV